MRKEKVDPKNYVYTPDDEIKMSGDVFVNVVRAISDALQNETKFSFEEKYDWVNQKTGKTISKPKKEDIARGIVVKIPSVKKTLESQPVVSRTPLGQYLLNVSLELEKQHLKNIERGDVKTKEEVENKSKEMLNKIKEISEEETKK
jgi:hypothetical protein